MKKESETAKPQGDVLGISESTGSIPRSNVPHGGHPQGIEIDRPSKSSGARDLPQGSGATSIDMGAGGEGNSIDPKR